jgi:hypothetical protein
LGRKLLFSQVDHENNIINGNETYPPSRDMENNLLRNEGSFQTLNKTWAQNLLKNLDDG